ncbi:hypothetical protein PIB30_092371 [Stylosanthes scabra]|uniref:Uncharacterized protein n=1 Tax=Stylosanthes scabra TaxID=79078 RepID=A0ABU6TW80_9FABA|nr:hypothetical protein [Stylosanthes scabra]
MHEKEEDSVAAKCRAAAVDDGSSVAVTIERGRNRVPGVQRRERDDEFEGGRNQSFIGALSLPLLLDLVEPLLAGKHCCDAVLGFLATTATGVVV